MIRIAAVRVGFSITWRTPRRFFSERILPTVAGVAPNCRRYWSWVRKWRYWLPPGNEILEAATIGLPCPARPTITTRSLTGFFADAPASVAPAAAGRAISEISIATAANPATNPFFPMSQLSPMGKIGSNRLRPV